MKLKNTFIALILAFICIVSGCSTSDSTTIPNNEPTQKAIETVQTTDHQEEPNQDATEEPAENNNDKSEIQATTFNFSEVPPYSGTPYVAINNNIPFFADTDYTTTSFEKYSKLDSLGRCGVAYANIGLDLMPTEERGNIGSVKPTGWHTIKYENVDGKYLYNRCHLIGFQLSGENANEQNLITGTRYMNIKGMLPFENMVADHVKETKNHVLYRVTPIFEGKNLLATGVLIEALSMEDNGDGICFNVFCYNEQPGIIIDHSNGDSKAEDGSAPYGSSAVVTPPKQETPTESSNTPTTYYIANRNSKKFHYPYCHSVDQMNESNKEHLNCTREQALTHGYEPCKRCNP